MVCKEVSEMDLRYSNLRIYKHEDLMNFSSKGALMGIMETQTSEFL